LSSIAAAAAADGEFDLAMVWICKFGLHIRCCRLFNHIIVVGIRMSGNVSLDIVWIDKFSQCCRPHSLTRRRSDNIVVVVGSTTDDGGVEEER
jgi:hypothetical protein